MKKFFALTLSAFLMLAMTPAAEAQFFKHLFGKKEPVRKPVQRPVQKPVASTKKTTAPKPAKKTQAEQLALPPSTRKNRYRIDVLTSIYLDELVKGGKSVYQVHIPDKALPGLNFYEGVKLATDSLNRNGYSMDVYIHDITDPVSSVATLINTSQLDSSDLIIGAVPQQQVGSLAAFAQKHQVNFISTLAPRRRQCEGQCFFHAFAAYASNELRGASPGRW